MINHVDSPDNDGSVFELYEGQSNYHIEFDDDAGYNIWEITDENEINYRQATKQRLTDFSSAKSASLKTSALRLSAPVSLGYFNHPHISEIIKENGDIVTERKEREQVFLEVLISKLEHFGALFIKYLRFRDKVALQPLLFDKQA
jgi:hypothetical protein